jgi:exosome complex RNA-binding protein Csl4
MKKKNPVRINFFLIFCGFLIPGLSAQAQNIDSVLSVYATKYSQERMYLHFDKPSYAAGETIWFKTYLMEDIYPAGAVKTVYLDWTDERGKIVLHGAYPVVNSAANGQFEIPADYNGKSVHIRGYTRWMLNFDSAFIYNKDIRILSAIGTSSKNEVAVIPSLQFFPEGGDAVAGISNKIAFKANDQWGRPVKVKGTITDNKGKTISTFHSLHDGMGYFLIIPEANASYTAKWKDEKGVDHATPLPVIKQTGISMQVSVAGAKRILNINFTPDVVQGSGTLHIIGTMYQTKVFEITENTNKGPVQKSIPTQNLPSGILTVTVLDDKWNALAERITYVNNNEFTFQPEMEMKQTGLSKRAKNQLQISIPDGLQASFSISVTDQDIDTDSSSNIISHLLLTSQLRGQVFNSAYYFSSTEDSVAQHLDLVMLTHGWRRFKWGDIVKAKFPKISFPRDSTYLSLSGKIFGVLPAQFRGAGNIVMFVKQKDSASKALMLPVLPDGTFNDPEKIFFDTIHVYYTFPKNSVLSDASVQFMDNRLAPPANAAVSAMFPFIDTNGNYRHSLLAAEANRIRDMVAGKVLEEVIVRAKTKSPLQILDEKYASGLFKSGDGYQFDLVNDPFSGSAMNIFTYLQGKVAGLQINANGSTPSLQWRGSTPSLFLDEMATDASLISTVNVNDVAYIKVFRPPFIGAVGGGAGGAIAIYTRKGSDVKQTPGKGLSNNIVYGYTGVRQFYSPNYGTFDRRNEEKDFRSTIYWNPNVILYPGKRQATLTFYNNDVSDFFRVVIEGMTSDGRLAHVEQIIE